MPILSFRKSYEELSNTVTAEFDQPIDRVWRLYADRSTFARWVALPMTEPATVHDHDLTPGGRLRFSIQWPVGPQSDLTLDWRVLAVAAPHYLFYEEPEVPQEGVEGTGVPHWVIRVTLSERPGGGTRMVFEQTFRT